MALVVYDYGLRVQTPWYSIFPPRDVDKTAAMASTLAISEHDQVKESHFQLPVSDGHRDDTEHRAEKAVSVYQDVGQQESQQPRLAAQDIMTVPPTTLPESASLQQAWFIFLRQKIRHIPVINDKGRLCGLLSERDLLRGTSVFEIGDTPVSDTAVVSDLMSRQVITVSPLTAIRDIAIAMGAYRIGALPVLDHDEALVGIVTRSDIIRVIVQQASLDLWG